MLIRETTLADVAGMDRIRQAIEPWHVATVETQERWFEGNPPEAKVFRVCAPSDEGLDAYVWGKLDLYADKPNSSIVGLGVHPTARGRGLATDLYSRVEANLRSIGATQILTNVSDDPVSLAFATSHGFVLGATNRFIAVDPRVLPPLPPTPPGVTLMTARESGPEPWHAVVDIAARDEPGDVQFAGMPYADWLTQDWPTIDLDLSIMAFVDGAPAATTALNANYASGKAMSVGSDNLREFRGRGLVKLIKSVSLRAAAEAGITKAVTGNDLVNAPMRAINAWLGYEYIGANRSAVKTLD